MVLDHVESDHTATHRPLDETLDEITRIIKQELVS